MLLILPFLPSSALSVPLFVKQPCCKDVKVLKYVLKVLSLAAPKVICPQGPSRPGIDSYISGK